MRMGERAGGRGGSERVRIGGRGGSEGGVCA